jgi:hypothetical protein
LVWPVAGDDPASASGPPSPKPRYRSAYRPPDPAALPEPAQWATLSDFELALALIDFGPLERELATMYVPSAKGQVPFHPVALFLAVCLRRELRLGWRALARLLASEHGVGWRRRLGFAEGVTPSASGLRYFFQAIGPAVFADRCPRFIMLLHAAAPARALSRAQHLSGRPAHAGDYRHAGRAAPSRPPPAHLPMGHRPLLCTAPSGASGASTGAPLPGT